MYTVVNAEDAAVGSKPYMTIIDIVFWSLTLGPLHPFHWQTIEYFSFWK